MLIKITNINEWHNTSTLKKIGNVSWSESIMNLHSGKNNDFNSKFHRRLAYDEILANLLVLSHVRQRVKKLKKSKKNFKHNYSNKLIKNFNFELTNGQNKVIQQINNDLKSDYKMFRLLQGDVGCGKTIVSFVAAANVIESNYQVALMAPTEILAKQHYDLAKNIFKSTDINIEFLSSKSEKANKKKILNNLYDGKINFIIGTHVLFQKNILFKNG